MVTTKQKFIRNIQEIKRKESKHNAIEGYHHTRVESKRIRNRELQKSHKIINKMAVTTYLSTIT